MKTLIKLLYILTPREQKLAIVLLTMILIMAFLDMLGVASIMPFIAILTNPDIIRNNILLNNIFEMTAIVGVQNDQQFIFILGIFVFLLLVFSLSFKALTIYLLIRFSAMREYTLGKRLVAGFLSQPYSWFLNRHSADLGKTILSEVSLVISHGIRPVMNLITFSAVTSMIIILLIVVDPKLSAIVGFTLVGSYGIIYAITRNFIKRIGYERLKANEELYKTITETFSAAKEIKVGGLEKEFTSRFSDPAKISAQHAASSQIISNLPRFFLEAIGFGGMILVILYLISINGTFLEALPIISLYAFAGYRLMPAIQQIYISLNQLRYVGSSLDDLYSDMKSFQPLILSKENKPLKLKESISLSHIHFSYTNSSKTTLKDINIKITE